MYLKQYMNREVVEGHDFAGEVIEQYRHPDEGPLVQCDRCSDGHHEMNFWAIFRQALALEEDSTLLVFVCLLMSTTLVPLASLDQIEKTPSGQDGLPSDIEEDLKAFGCKLIHEAGILLKQFAISDLVPPPSH